MNKSEVTCKVLYTWLHMVYAHARGLYHVRALIACSKTNTFQTSERISWVLSVESQDREPTIGTLVRRSFIPSSMNKTLETKKHNLFTWTSERFSINKNMAVSFCDGGVRYIHRVAVMRIF